MLKTGWIKLHRTIFQNELFIKHPEWGFPFLYIVSQAGFNRENEDYAEVSLSINSLAGRFNLTQRNVRSMLSNLIRYKMLKKATQRPTQRPTRKRLKYHIVKYNVYQENRLESDTVTDIETDTLGDFTTLLKKEDKEVKNTEGEKVSNFLAYLKENYPILLKLKQPITAKEAEKIVNKYKTESIVEVLQAMANKKDLLSKYTSCYLTMLNWLNRRKDSEILEHNKNYIIQHKKVQTFPEIVRTQEEIADMRKLTQDFLNTHKDDE